LLPILGILLILAAIYLVRPREPGVVAVVYTEKQSPMEINTGEVIDATDASIRIEPQLGYRYKVFVMDESEDRSSGIARIGGRTTFIPGARPGQTVIVDVTRVRPNVIDASLAQVLSQVELPPKAPRKPFTPQAGDAAGHVVNGAEMDVVITEASSKNPQTEGVARINGLVVFVNGVPTIGERVNVRITERRERMAFAEPTGKPAGTDPLPSARAPARGPFTPRPGDPAGHVVPGAEMDVTIEEESTKNPYVEGVARINGLVVFVEGATEIGSRVNVRITERRERMAFAELSGKPVGSEPVVVAPTGRSAFQPPPGDPVVVGAEMDVTITEKASKNPEREGVARVNGLVVFVKNATTLGERVNVRITERRNRAAVAELTGKPVGESRRAFVPPADDSAAHVVPGAEMEVIIEDQSRKNPETEGVARVNGLVVFVDGATEVGETVRIRITDRRPRIAFANVIPAQTEPTASAAE
jgi:predicted RNA-binding protein with TRAM domain